MHTITSQLYIYIMTRVVARWKERLPPSGAVVAAAAFTLGRIAALHMQSDVEK